MAGIFISYRRDDASGYAGRLYADLAARFGRDRVFMDIDTLQPGMDFVESLDGAIGTCEVFIALIGPRWLSATDAAGNRRLDNPDDFVSLEIGTALARGRIRVVPVLVGGAGVPASAALPEPLKALARRHAFEISDGRWDYDVETLVKRLESVISPPQPAASPRVAAEPPRVAISPPTPTVKPAPAAAWPPAPTGAYRPQPAVVRERSAWRPWGRRAGVVVLLLVLVVGGGRLWEALRDDDGRQLTSSTATARAERTATARARRTATARADLTAAAQQSDGGGDSSAQLTADAAVWLTQQAAASNAEVTETPSVSGPGEKPRPTVIVNADNVNLRSEPSSSSAVVRQLAAGEVLSVTGEPIMDEDGNTWYPVVDADGFSGFVVADFLEFE